MGEAIGAKTIDLEWVQVHPTGLVKPDDADAKIKFLAAEAYVPAPSATSCFGIAMPQSWSRNADMLGVVQDKERRQNFEWTPLGIRGTGGERLGC